jgi:fumarate reductase subunit C
MKFILRELSSLAVASFVALTLLLLRALSQGPKSYAEFQEELKTPWLIVLNGISLFFVLFHTITWFNLAPRAMVVRVRGQRVPDWLIAGSNYVAWLVISAAVAWLILRG